MTIQAVLLPKETYTNGLMLDSSTLGAWPPRVCIVDGTYICLLLVLSYHIMLYYSCLLRAWCPVPQLSRCNKVVANGDEHNATGTKARNRSVVGGTIDFSTAQFQFFQFSRPAHGRVQQAGSWKCNVRTWIQGSIFDATECAGVRQRVALP